MLVLKAQFKDKAGVYNMTWSYNPESKSSKDLIQTECKKYNSKLVNIILNEKLN
jgi:hypothetical protein